MDFEHNFLFIGKYDFFNRRILRLKRTRFSIKKTWYSKSITFETYALYAMRNAFIYREFYNFYCNYYISK